VLAAAADHELVGDELHVRLSDGRTAAVQVVNPDGASTVVICHGIPGSRLLPHWLVPIAEAAGVRAVGIDRPGFGGSDTRPGRTILEWPDDAAEVADHLGVQRFAVLGISGGSPYALACCARIPDRITRVVLAAPVTPWDRPALRARLSERRATLPVLWAVGHSRIVARGFYALPARGLRNVPEKAFAALAKSLSEPDRRVLAEPKTSSFVMATMREGLRSGGRAWAEDEALVDGDWGFSPSDVSKDVPIEVWHGEQDSAVPSASARRLVEALSNAKLLTHPDDGHFSMGLARLDAIVPALVRAG
jgi:pimeloyl-ACP methyl ester carboxylesterase